MVRGAPEKGPLTPKALCNIASNPPVNLSQILDRRCLLVSYKIAAPSVEKASIISKLTWFHVVQPWACIYRSHNLVLVRQSSSFFLGAVRAFSSWVIHKSSGSVSSGRHLWALCCALPLPALGSQGSETEPLDDPAHSHRSHCILPCSRRLAYHTLALHMCTTASVHVQEGSAATLHVPPETNPTRLLCAEFSPGLRPQPSDAPKGAPSIRTRPQNARHHATCTTYPWLLPTRCDHTKVTLALIRPPYQLRSILT